MLLMVVNHIYTEVIYAKNEIPTTTQNSLDITIRWLNCLKDSLLIVFWKESAKFTTSADPDQETLTVVSEVAPL